MRITKVISSEKKVTNSNELYDALRSDIGNGRIGDRLPAITQLCSLYNVSHCTVKNVVDRLKNHKYIEGHKGKCVFVNKAALGNRLFQKNIVFYLHISTMSIPYYLMVLAHIRQLLQDSGSSVHFVNSREQFVELGFKPDVVIVSEISDESEIEEIEMVCGSGRVIKLNDLQHHYKTVGTDNYNGGYQAAEYLYKMGHRKVGLISRDLGILNDFFSNRYKGFKEFVDGQPEMECFNSEVYMKDDLKATTRAATEKLFGLCSEITAIFTFTDMLALGVYAYCDDHGLNIPNDISVLSFDNRDFSGLLSPALTTFQEDSEQVAVLIRKMIFSIITRQDHENIVLVKPFLIERNSVRNINAGKQIKPLIA
jgi:DNA-binding LacI/PurR family transcriptional regulator